MKYIWFTLKVIAVLVATLLYLLIAGHFIYANSQHVVAGNYQWIPANNMYDSGYCPNGMCMTSGLMCGNDLGATPENKGFPLATAWSYPCGEGESTLQSVVAVIVDFIYIVTITLLYVLLLRKLTGRFKNLRHILRK